VPLGHAEAEIDTIESSATKPAIAIFFIIASMHCEMQYKGYRQATKCLKESPALGRAYLVD